MDAVSVDPAASVRDAATSRLRDDPTRRSAPEAGAESPPNEAPTRLAPERPEGDRVTLASRDGGPPGDSGPGGDESLPGLRELLAAMRGPARSGPGRSALPNRGSFASLEAFNLHALFSNARNRAAGSASFNRTLDTLGEQFQNLLQADPRQAGELSILLSALAALDPEHADELLEQVSRSLALFERLTTQAAAVGVSSPPAARAVASSPSEGAPAAAQIVRFSLDFEMETTAEVETILGEMTDQGVRVRTARLSASTRVAIHIEFTGVRGPKQADPLVLDLAGDGVDLSSLEEGVDFDVDADGRTDRVAFVRGDDAFLALDHDGDGMIGDGGELFGDQHGAVNGFEELRRSDENRDGRIDAADAVYDALRLLHDRDGDGTVRPNELSTLVEQGISAIDLNWRADQARDDGKGNRLAERAYFERFDGSRGAAVDAWLGYA